MSRVIQVKANQNITQHTEDICDQHTHQGLDKTMQLTNTSTTPVQIFNKKCVTDVIPVVQGTECRICLQTESESNQKLIQPCQCTGSVQSVHQGCFTEWISRSLSTKTNRQLAKVAKDGIECDLCKMKFQIRFSFERICTSWEKFKEKARRRMCEFTTLISMLILTVILFAVSLALLPANPLDINLDRKQELPKPGHPPTASSINTSDDWLKVALFCSISLLVLILGFVIYLLIIEYGFTYRTEFGYKGKHKKTIKGIVLPE